MIRYSLRCEDGHEFDSWFPGSAAYDEQVRRGLVECPLCHSTHVMKAIMAPRVARTDTPKALAARASSDETPVANSEGSGDQSPPPMPVVMDERLVALRSMIREMRTAIAERTTDVGSSFPDEARKMHFGEAEHKPIRGEATLAEARELIEDGVPILPVPTLPDDRN